MAPSSASAGYSLGGCAPCSAVHTWQAASCRGRRGRLNSQQDAGWQRGVQQRGYACSRQGGGIFMPVRDGADRLCTLVEPSAKRAASCHDKPCYSLQLQTRGLRGAACLAPSATECRHAPVLILPADPHSVIEQELWRVLARRTPHEHVRAFALLQEPFRCHPCSPADRGDVGAQAGPEATRGAPSGPAAAPEGAGSSPRRHRSPGAPLPPAPRTWSCS